MNNPLLKTFTLPPFSKIRHDHIIPATEHIIKYCHDSIKKITSKKTLFTWDNLCQPMQEINNYFIKIWSIIEHLNAVQNTVKLRQAYKHSLTLVTKYNIWVGHNIKLYKSYLSLQQNKYYSKLNTEQKKSINNILRDFKLSGVHLSIKKQKQYEKIITQLSILETSYNNNVFDSTVKWNKIITNKIILDGIPNDILENIKNKETKNKKTEWIITLDLPIYLSILTNCNNSSFRKECYYAYNTRASNIGFNENTWDNGPIIKKILKLRHNLAKLLGYTTYANLSLKTKMAKNPKNFLKFFATLIKYAKKKGKKELKQLQSFTKKHFNYHTKYPWDITFYSEKQKQHLFSINEEKLRSYFPINTVLQGLFKILNRIFGILIIQNKTIKTWNPTVSFFDIFDEKNEFKGSFYLDLYTRQNKRSGAWMSEFVGLMRNESNKKTQKPIAHIICNFSPSVNETPTLLTHNEVITLFHEFGHALQHILTHINIPNISGIHGIPLDAIESCSQLMENYCWEKESITLISGHFNTKEPLPINIIKKLQKIRKYQSGLFILHQLKLCLFDFIIHYKPQKNINISKILKKIHKKTSITPYIKWIQFPNTFSHIFSGEYSVGYYSYLWSNILSADAWSRFEKEGIFNKKTGKSFIKHVLSQGGSQNPLILFTKFIGRKPKIDAMLQQYGITINKTDLKS
ncbi:MAG: oligopeptidase A [Candidatus Westeberhardia cardiocondylae]|nr:oligopeptidase A [Candidatus Westeberhardia cardiocondylae]